MVLPFLWSKSYELRSEGDKLSLLINKDYPCNPTNYAKCNSRDIKYIVIHYVGAVSSALQNAKYFMNNSNLQASAHYFVGHASENGQIYQSVDDINRAWHCGGTSYVHKTCRNNNAIGIEMCCHKNSLGKWYFDNITVDKTIELTKQLMKKYNVNVDNVIRHYDVTKKECPKPFVKDINAWIKFKERLIEEDEEDLVRYKKLNDIPTGLRGTIEVLMNAGIIVGDGSDSTGNNDVIDLSHDQVRTLVFAYRGGAFDKKLKAVGLKTVVG